MYVYVQTLTSVLCLCSICGTYVRVCVQTLSAAALLMSVFSGLDHVAAASQETRDPSRHLPSALPLTSTLLFLILLLATSALTLACPWQDLTERAPIARAFESKGIYAANHVIGAGALLGLMATAMGRLFHPPRILHCMAADGLLPAWLGKTSLASTPVLGGLLTGGSGLRRGARLGLQLPDRDCRPSPR